MTDEKDVQTPVEPEAQQDVAQAEPVEPAAPVEGAAEAQPVATDDAPAQESAPAEDATPEPAEDAAGTGEEGDADADMLAALKDLPEDEQKAQVDDINFPEPSVSAAEFQQLSEPAGKTEGRNIELLMDVNLPISIELGRTRMSISDILSLGPGSVVELNKLAGEPVDLLVNQKVVARGEVVVIDENFGVRITQLMTPEERLKSLGEES